MPQLLGDSVPVMDSNELRTEQPVSVRKYLPQATVGWVEVNALERESV